MGKGKGEGGWKGSWPARPSSLLSPRCSSYAWIFQWIVPVVQPIEDAPLGQRDDGIRRALRVVLQRPERVYCNKKKKQAGEHAFASAGADSDGSGQTAGGGPTH